MRTSDVLVRSPDFTVRTVDCPGATGRWSAPEPSGFYGVVLVRSGMFRLQSDDRDFYADRSLGYVETPGREQRFAHPVNGRDVCTAITVSPELWHGLAGDTVQAPIPVDGRIELAHLMLLRSAHDESFAAAEGLLNLLGAVLQSSKASLRGSAVVDRARQVLATDHPDGRALISLARLLGVSPYYLSRIFHQETGVTVTRYRNRVRVRKAIDRIQHGECDLGSLAADLGFADHAHLSRTVKAEAGHTPSQLRRLLQPA